MGNYYIKSKTLHHFFMLIVISFCLTSFVNISASAKGANHAQKKESPPITGNDGLIYIPAGSFEMGNHHSDKYGTADELPVHKVTLDAFYMGKYEVTNQEFSDALNYANAHGMIEVKNGEVYLKGGSDVMFQTAELKHSKISYDGKKFTPLENKEKLPATSFSWYGSMAYCNWRSLMNGLQTCYDLNNWTCDFSKNGYRMPTEAEWEYAARGGKDTYYVFPWGNEPDGTKANLKGFDNPYMAGDIPHLTPVGFFNGELHKKEDFNWPGNHATFQTSDGANGYGLYDMISNVWEWCNDLMMSDYYASSPSKNPRGPSAEAAARSSRGGRNTKGGKSGKDGKNGKDGRSEQGPRIRPIIRGGCWGDIPFHEKYSARVAERDQAPHNHLRNWTLGVRVVRAAK